MRENTDDPLYLIGDHLGSTSLVFDTSGQEVAKRSYLPFGEEWGVSVTDLPTDYTFTGQREAEEIGLKYYVARWYDSEIGHFIQADSVVPGIENSLAWNRFAYVKYNPLTYVDPSGHADIVCPNGQCSVSGQGTVKYYQSLMKDVFNFVFRDNWTLQEMKQIFVVGWRITTLVGGISNFKQAYGNGVWSFYHYESDGFDKGLTSSAGTIGLKADFTNWTLAHELAHAYDFSNGCKPSSGMREAVGAGKGDWWKSIARGLGATNEFFWYDPGDSPPVFGADSNFNAKEDFAESFAAVVLPDEAIERNIYRTENDPGHFDEWNWTDSYQSFDSTPRGQYIRSILRQ